MANIQPLRDETMTDPKALRLRLNELIKKVNEQPGRWQALRVPNVQAGVPVVVKAPPFNVGAVVIAGVNATAGAAAPTAAPWCSFSQLQDGRLNITVSGLAAWPALYAVNLVLFEAEAAQ